MKNKSLYVFLFAIFLLAGCSKKNVAGGKTGTGELEAPQRIVALSPASVEILFAIGAGNQVAAVSDLTDYPPEAVSLPKVGGFDGKTLSMEKIISYKPDLVYLAEGMHNFLIQELEANKKGGIGTDDEAATNRPGIFAGGDAVTGAATVIKAMGAGKKAAASIDEFLSK